MKAASVIQSFYAKFTELRTFNRAVIERARTQGRLASMFGRRRHFPYISSSNLGLRAQAQRQAFNFLIQGGQKAIRCKKRLAIFPSPAGMSLTKLSLAGNN
jgi:DNA polymerase I-like protein with 3'-5' exonuclease and polymerase domains